MRRHVIISLAIAALAAPAYSQSTDDVSELKAQVNALLNRIENLEKENTAKASAPPSQDAVTKGDIPGSFKLPGSKTSVSLSGYVKGQMSYSSRGPLGNPGGSDELLIPSTIPLSNTPNTALKKDYWKASAKESRLTLRTYTPSDWGPITTLLEADFYGTAGTETATNSNNFRLRHAWGTLGNFGAGQFWSNIANMTAVPETIDFTPQIGIFGALRQPGFRWTQPTSYGFWSAAIENPESRIVSTAGAVTGPDDDKSPLFNAKVHFKLGGGEYEAVGVLARVNTAEAAFGAAPAPQRTLSKTGYGVGFSGFIPTTGDYNRIMFGVSATRSMGRPQAGLFGDVVLVTSGTGAATTGELRGVDTRGGFIAYRHRWTPSLRSTFAYSKLSADYPGGLGATAGDVLDKMFWTSHANLIWTPVPQVDFGIEYMHASRQVDSGLSGTLNRLYMSAKYKF